MAQSTAERVSLRTQIAAFGSGMVANGGTNVVIPLWVLSLDPSPFAFGLVMGARAFLPFLFSIHGGVLMDRLGARQVMVVFATVGLTLPILFPALPYVWAAGILQLILGFTTTMSWVGAQTVVAQNMKGDAKFFGRLSFCNRFGNLICPLVGGAAWDLFGPTGGFISLSVWSAILFTCALMLPRQAESGQRWDKRMRLRDMVPKMSEYAAAIRLLAIPSVAIVVIASVLNIGTGAIEMSFYVAYLEKIGMNGTLIGILFASPNIVALTGTLCLGRLLRVMGDMRLLNAAVIVSIVTIAIVPCFESFLALFLLGAVRGWSTGISQPLMLSIPANAVPPGSQGASAGLRISLNRIVQTFLPPVMGGIVQLIGLENSFFVVGGVLLFLVALSLYLVRDIMPPWPSRDRPNT